MSAQQERDKKIVPWGFTPGFAINSRELLALHLQMLRAVTGG